MHADNPTPLYLRLDFPFATLRHSFNPKDSSGNVERWLIECELAMRDTLKDTIHRAFEDYAQRQRVQWVEHKRAGEWGGPTDGFYAAHAASASLLR